MKKSYAKQLKEGPVFRITKQKEFGGALELEVKGKGIGDDWQSIALFLERKYAMMLIKAITLATKDKK